MPQRHYPAGNGQVTAPASRPSGPADVSEAHQQAGRRFRANGVGSFVGEQGSGPAVLCLHGMTGTSFLYRKVLAELAARGLRGVAFDLPGFGLASARPATTTAGRAWGDSALPPSTSSAWTASTLSSMTLADRSASIWPPPCPAGSAR